MHAQQPGGLGDRQGRVGGSWRKRGRHGSWRKCELDGAEPTNLTVLANRPMVPARSALRPARSAGRRRGSPRPAPSPIATTASSAKRRVADEPRALAGAARVAADRRPGSARRASDDQRDRQPATPRPAPAATRPAPTRSRDGARRRRQDEPEGDQRRRRRPGRPSRRAAGAGRPRPGRASPRTARAWSGRAGGRARPRAAARRSSSRPGTPTTMACSTDETCSIRSRTGVSRAVSRRHPVGDVGGRPDRFARHDDEPVVERGVVDGDRHRAPRGPRTGRARGRPRTTTQSAPRRELEPGPAEDERAMGVVLELGLGVDPAADLDVARPARRPSARASATVTSGVDASSRPTR